MLRFELRPLLHQPHQPNEDTCMWSKIAAVLLFLGMTAISTAAQAKIDPSPVRMEFQIETKDLNELMMILVRYSNNEELRLENVGSKMPQKENRPIFYVNLYADDVFKITVSNFLREDKVLLLFYEKKEESRAKSAFDSLTSQIRARWPDLHIYDGL